MLAGQINSYSFLFPSIHRSNISHFVHISSQWMSRKFSWTTLPHHLFNLALIIPINHKYMISLDVNWKHIVMSFTSLVLPSDSSKCLWFYHRLILPLYRWCLLSSLHSWRLNICCNIKHLSVKRAVIIMRIWVHISTKIVNLCPFDHSRGITKISIAHLDLHNITFEVLAQNKNHIDDKYSNNPCNDNNTLVDCKHSHYMHCGRWLCNHIFHER